jgi:hypothetical protein
MNIIMNEAMQGSKRFSRLFVVNLRRELGDDEGNFAPMDWQLAMKNLTQAIMEDENRQLQPVGFVKEGDTGFLPCLFQTQCTKFSAIGLAANFALDLPVYTEETLAETPVIKEISDNLLNDGIYLPFFMFIDINDYNSVIEADQSDADVYAMLVSDLTSEARGENLTDFYVATVNVSKLIKQLNFDETSFVEDNGENTMRVLYPMLMSAVSTDVSSPYPPEIFQVSVYFQNVQTNDNLNELKVEDTTEKESK